MGATGQDSTKLSPHTGWREGLGKASQEVAFQALYGPCVGWDETQEAFQGVETSAAKAWRTMCFPGMIV